MHQGDNLMTKKKLSKKQHVRQKLINKLLKEYKFVTTKEELVLFFKEMLREAKALAMTDLSLLFEGYQYFWEHEYKTAIMKFMKSTEANPSIAYPWNGLGGVYNEQKDYPKAEEAYRKAIELDDKFAYPWNGLGSIYGKQKFSSKAIAAFHKAIELDDKFANPWNGLGNVYDEQKDYPKAEEAYRKSIEMDDKFAYPWNGLGNIYAAQKDYSKAEEAYRKSIELDDKFTSPWDGLGYVYEIQKDYPKAEEAYRKAIELDENSSYSWNGLGNIYDEQKDYPKAEEAYLKAIELDDKSPYSYYNYGLLLFDLKRSHQAATYFEKALRFAKQEKNQYLASLVNNNLKTARKRIKEAEAIKDVRKDVAKKDSLARLLSDTEGFEEEIFNNQKAFQSFVKETKQMDNSLYLKVLRRWNSYTPIVADNYHIGKGGGYFLKAQGEGIVIDPGFNFIDNFKGSGHSFDEIDIVMITHAHNDHTSDLESILTLLNTCNKRRKGLDDFARQDTVRADIAKKQGIDISDVSEEDIERVFMNESPRRKTVDLYLTKSVQKKFSGMLDLYSDDYTHHVIEKNEEKILLNGALKLKVIEAKHNDIISDRHSVGFIFEFNGTVLIYTGDTGWDDKIKKQYADIRNSYKDKHVVLLAHLGGFKVYERNYLFPEEKSKAFYKNHLGRLGLGRLVEVLKPDICFISEFGEELRKHREELTDIYNSIFDKQTFFLPADIDLEYHFNEKKIRAITQLDLDEYDYSTNLVEPNNVRTCLLRKDYSLHYFDSQASFKESDLMQVLIEKFDRSTR